MRFGNQDIAQTIFRPISVRCNACGTVFIEQTGAAVVVEREAIAQVIQTLVAAILVVNQKAGGAGAESEESVKPLPPSTEDASE